MKQTLSTQQGEMSQQLQSQVDVLKVTSDALTASNTALKTKVVFLSSYIGLQESSDGQVTNLDSSVIVSKKTFANVIAESSLTSSTRPSGVTVPNTIAPTGAPTAAISSLNLAYKPVPHPSAKFSHDDNKLNKTIKGAVLQDEDAGGDDLKAKQ